MAKNDREHERELRNFITWMRAELDRGETIWYEDRMVVMGAFYDLLSTLDEGDWERFKTTLEAIRGTYDRWQAMDFGIKESSRFFDRFQAVWSWVHSAADELLEVKEKLGRGEIFERYAALTRAEIRRSFSIFIPEKNGEEGEEEKPNLAWKLTDEQWEKFEPLGKSLGGLSYAWHQMGRGKGNWRVGMLRRHLAAVKEVVHFEDAFVEYTVNKLTGCGQAIPNLLYACIHLEAALAYDELDQEKMVWRHLDRMGAMVSRVSGGEKWKREMLANGEEVLIDI